MLSCRGRMNWSEDMDDEDKDSEFDSEVEDAEFQLYQQLYFETNSDLNEADTKCRSSVKEQHDGETVYETCDRKFVQVDAGQQNQILNPKYMPETGRFTSTTASNIDKDQSRQFDNCIYVNTLEGGELCLTDFAANLNERNTQNNPITQQRDHHANSDNEVSLYDDHSLIKESLQSVRKRLSSTCSDGSIPGSVPLDVLYCNLVTSDEEENDIIENRLIMKNIETNDQESNKEKDKANSVKRKRRTSYSDSEEDSRCNNLISAASKTAITEDDVHEVGDESNSDDEIYVLPPPRQKNPEILTLGSESSSDFEVEAGDRDITSVKSNNNKYRKIEKEAPSSTLTARKGAKSKGMHQVSEDRRKHNRKEADIIVVAGSESDSCDVAMPEATKGTDLTLNIDKSLSGWIKTITKDADTPKKKNIAKKPQKSKRSSVDFTKGRANTTTRPSCEKWTQSMANFYDSDVSDDFDVSEIHYQQSGSLADWQLISSDYQIQQRRRYYNAPERCKRCRQEGHTTNNCPRVPVCHLCCKTDHASRINCPENCCFRCGGEPHFFCRITHMSRICSLCGYQGHNKDICPDLWRQFHLTTKGNAVKVPTEDTTRPLRERYCYSCGKQGHYGHECHIRFQNKSYAHVPQSPVNYCSPVKLIDDHFTVNNDGPQLTPTEENVTTMDIKSKDAGKIIGQKGVMVKWIVKESGAHVRVVKDGRPQVHLFGPLEARLKAQEMINLLFQKREDKCVEPFDNMATDNNDSNQNISWSGKFLTNLDRRKPHVLRKINVLKNILYTKKNKDISYPLKKLKSFLLRKESVPSAEFSGKLKKELSVIAINALVNGKYLDGYKIHEKLTTLHNLVQSSHFRIVPENICVQISEIVQPFLDPSLDELDELLQYAENCKDSPRKKKKKTNKANKRRNMKKKLKKSVVPNEKKEIKKRKPIKTIKKKNKDGNEMNKRINPARKNRLKKVAGMKKAVNKTLKSKV